MPYLTPDFPHGEKPTADTRNRKCLACGKRLNSYNLNRYCHAHSVVGIEKEWDEAEKLRIKKYKEQVKKIMEKKRRKHARNRKDSH